ncbi:hypothetical protein ACJJTC_005296 [Scirpophaga incertulas]
MLQTGHRVDTATDNITTVMEDASSFKGFLEDQRSKISGAANVNLNVSSYFIFQDSNITLSFELAARFLVRPQRREAWRRDAIGDMLPARPSAVRLARAGRGLMSLYSKITYNSTI